jgi:hypothetical protein
MRATKETILHHHYYNQSYPSILSLKMRISLVLDSGPLIYIKYPIFRANIRQKGGLKAKCLARDKSLSRDTSLSPTKGRAP